MPTASMWCDAARSRIRPAIDSVIASTWAAGDETRSSSRICPCGSTTAARIFVPPTSTPHVTDTSVPVGVVVEIDRLHRRLGLGAARNRGGQRVEHGRRGLHERQRRGGQVDADVGRGLAYDMD